MREIKILYIGYLDPWTRSCQRYNVLNDLGYRVIALNEEPTGFYVGVTDMMMPWVKLIIKKAFRKLGYPLDITYVNEKAIALMRFFRFDIVWSEKVLALKPATLLRLKKLNPSLKICFYSEDDMYTRRFESRYFLKGLPFYDAIFTTKSYNCDNNELPSLGAKKVVFVENTYDKKLHRPVVISKEEKERWGADVSFVGCFEPDRAARMLFLADNGVRVRIWGFGWGKWVGRHRNLIVENKPAFDQDYVRVICASDINLAFLNKSNRDLQTSRSVEIPACGAFMLAERTVEHSRLFEEGKEAEFFNLNDPGELLSKIRFYLKNDDKRLAIARAGRERCLNSGYSHHDRLIYMLSHVITGSDPQI